MTDSTNKTNDTDNSHEEFVALLTQGHVNLQREREEERLKREYLRSIRFAAIAADLTKLSDDSLAAVDDFIANGCRQPQGRLEITLEGDDEQLEQLNAEIKRLKAELSNVKRERDEFKKTSESSECKFHLDFMSEENLKAANAVLGKLVDGQSYLLSNAEEVVDAGWAAIKRPPISTVQAATMPTSPPIRTVVARTTDPATPRKTLAERILGK